MIRHAKASTAGSTQGQARGLGRSFAGAISAAFLIALCALALTVSSALAARGHQFKESFGTPCTVEPCAPNTLKEPTAVAVNEANGDIYVLDQASARVGRYSSAGAFLGWFDGGPSFESEGSTEPTTEAGHGGNPGEVETGPFQYPSTENPANVQVSAIAVDNSCALKGLTGSACEEADPSNEDVYVIDSGNHVFNNGHEVIDKFGPTGEYLGQITEYEKSPGEFKRLIEPEGLALATDGSVWVLQQGETPSGILEHYANGLGNPFHAQLPVESPNFGFLTPGLALDGEGAFYRRAREGDHFEAEKLTPSGHRDLEHIGNLDSTGLAVDQRLDNSFIATATFLAAFSSTGSKLEVLGEEEGEHHLNQAAGLAVDSAAENIYAADRSAGEVVVFEAQQPKTPEIVSEGATAISSGSATLLGELNPRSDPGAEPPEAPTTYHFQYGPCPSGLASCASRPFPFSTPDEELPPDFEIHSVSTLVSGLEPATAYHYRLSAENSLSTEPTLGEELTFTTQGPASGLLDRRAYELVSPPDKRGASIEPIEETGIVQAASSGNAITYLANAATEPQPQGVGKGQLNVLSARAPAGGWASEDLGIPHDGPTGAAIGSGAESWFFNEDLSHVFIQPFGGFTPSVTPEASEQTPYRRTTYLGSDPSEFCRPVSMSCYRPLVTGREGFANVPEGTVFGLQNGQGLLAGDCPLSGETTCGPHFRGASADGAHAIVESRVALTSTPISAPALYEWSADAPPAQQLQLLSLQPGSSTQTVEESILGGSQSRNLRGAISADGSRVFFYEGKGSRGQLSNRLFLRDTASEETLRLDAGEGCAECESGEAVFQLATPDGSRVFFTDVRRLTEDSGAHPESPEKTDLYECRIEVDGEGHLACALTDLTPPNGGEPADIQGFLTGASTDGSSLYFVAQGALSEGEGAVHGNCEGTFGKGECNLYRYDTETRTAHLVAVLSGADSHNWAEPHGLSARVSPDGEWLAFLSQRSLTGYDNRDAATGKPAAELYLYSASSESLLCASCNPTGARPRAALFDSLNRVGGHAGMRSWNGLVAATIPPWVGSADSGNVATHQPRYLSDSGRVFFNSLDALAPTDSNGTADVYEYEPPGVGTCSEADPAFAPRNGGCIALISSGASAEESSFLDASENGNDVFFLTNSRLTIKDPDTGADVYDARVDGGEAPIASPPECQGDACQNPAAPPNDPTPSSLNFHGVGNVSHAKAKKQKHKAKKQKHMARKHHSKRKAKHKSNKRHASKSRRAPR